MSQSQVILRGGPRDGETVYVEETFNFYLVPIPGSKLVGMYGIVGYAKNGEIVANSVYLGPMSLSLKEP